MNSALQALAGSATLFLACGCTTLGPMPAMTGIPVTPIERSGLELQTGIVPGYYLSSTVREDRKASAMSQALGLLEPDELIGVPGLFAGARYAGGSDQGAALEPVLGYRTSLDDAKRYSILMASFLAYASEEQNGASFSALRGGLDAGFDVRVTPVSSYAELHANLGLSMTGLDADGRYCLGVESKFGIDCPEPSSPSVAAAVSGIFPSAHLGLSVDFARHLRSAFHGLRLGFDAAFGTMPTVVAGQQGGLTTYASGGLSLTVGLGASE